MERTLRVIGQGKVSVKADRIGLSIQAEGRDREYEKAVEKAAAETRGIKETIENAGLDGKELKTTYFSVHPEYENVEDSRGNMRQEFLDFRFDHHTEIYFPNDPKQLGRIFYALSHCEWDINFSFRYTVADPGAVKEQLLKNATEDARHKAEILAESAGVSLGELLSIDFDGDEGLPEISPFQRMRPMAKLATMAAESPSYDLDIEAEDIQMENSVSMIWEIR